VLGAQCLVSVLGAWCRCSVLGMGAQCLVSVLGIGARCLVSEDFQVAAYLRVFVVQRSVLRVEGPGLRVADFVNRSRFTVLGLRFTIYGLRCTVYGLRFTVYGLRFRFMVYG